MTSTSDDSLSGIQDKYLPFLEEMQVKAHGTAVESKWHQLFVAILTPGQGLSVDKLKSIEKQLEEVKSLYDTKVQHTVQYTEHSEKNEILAEEGDNQATSTTTTECFHVDEFPAAPINQVEKPSSIERLPACHTPLWSEHSYARVDLSCYEMVSGRKSSDSEVTVDAIISEDEEDDYDDSLRLVIDESVDTDKNFETEAESAIVASPSRAPPAAAPTVEPPVGIEIEEQLSYPEPKENHTLGVLEIITALDARITQKEKQENLEKLLKSKAGKKTPSSESNLLAKRRAPSNRHVEAGNKNMDDVFAKKPKLDVSKKSVVEKETPQRPKRTLTRPADDPEGVKGLDRSQDSVPSPPVLEQLWIYRSICNIAYAKSRRGFIYKCLVRNCRFQSLVKDHLQDHLKKKHEEQDWNGFCNICMAIVDQNTSGNRIIDEFQHMERHVKEHVNANDTSMTSIQQSSQPVTANVDMPPATQSQPNTSEDSIISTLKKLPSSIIVKQVPKNLTPAVAQAAPEITPRTKTRSKVIQSYVQPEMLRPWLKSGSANIKSDLLVLAMQTQICLTATYKCMSSTCCFFTTDAQVFRKHIACHLKATFSDKKNFLLCSNCEFQGLTCEHLIRHYDTVHVFDRYQCNYCFYRSSSDSNVLTHQKMKHKAKPNLIIECAERKPRNNQAEIDGATKSWKQNVQPITCIFCRGIFFVLEHFKHHLTTHDERLRARCIKCGNTATRDTMSNHLEKCHGLGLYHCIHCVFGTDDFELLREHIANDHPSKIPMFCERTEMRNADESPSPSSILATCLQKMNHTVNKNFIIKASTDEDMLRNAVNLEELTEDLNVQCSDSSQMPRKFPILKPKITLKKHMIVAQMPSMVASSSKSSIMSLLLKPL